MFPKRMWVLPTVALALALVLTSVFAATVQAQGTPAGEYCIKGIVIDWEEEPLGGWLVTVENPAGEIFQDISDQDEEDEGKFKFEVGETYPPSNSTFPGIPGVYRAWVDVPLTGPDSAGPWEGVTPGLGEDDAILFEIEAGRHDCVNIRFKVKPVVQVTVVKFDSNHVPLPNWTIDAIPGAGNLFAEPQSETTSPVPTGIGALPTISGTVVFTLTPGNWIFTERQPEPDEEGDRPDRFQPVLPPTGRAELDVEWPGEPPYVIYFKNEFSDNGCIFVRKWAAEEIPDDSPAAALVQLPYGAAGWGFQLMMTDGTIFSQGVTDAEGNLIFRNLPYGPYVVVEEDRPGWQEDEIRGLARDVTVTSGECQLVEFFNEQDDSGFCIEGYKRDANGLVGLPGWEIEVDSLHEGGWDFEDEADFYEDPNTPEDDDPYYFEDNKFVTDGEGKYKIRFPDNDYRIPGAQFEICEDIEDADGWLPQTPTCQTVTLPDHPGACVQAEDFINEQVGHAESEKMKEKREEMKWEDMPAGMGGPDGQGGYDGQGGHDGDPQCKNTHSVKPGETLFTIGDSYDVSPQAMVDANPSVRDHADFWVYDGQTLCIP